MSKYNVQAVKRPGFETVSRGGRAWPSAAPVEVEVLDQEECPTIDIPDGPGKTRKMLDPKRIGRKAWASVVADGRLSKTPVGLGEVGASEEVTALRTRVAELEQKLAEALKSPATEVPSAGTDATEQLAAEGEKSGDGSPKPRARSK